MIPTDEEIDYWLDRNCYEPEDTKRAIEWYRGKLQPTLDLVEQIREARKEYEAEVLAFELVADGEGEAMHEVFGKLDELRDKLELGE